LSISRVARAKAGVRFFFALIALLVGTGALAFNGVDITGQGYGGDFRLLGHDGKAHRAADFAGKVVVLNFGFTHCPDLCPTTLAALASATRLLGDDAKRVQVLFITVDPERDTPRALASYVQAFDPRFLGLTGDAGAIRDAARKFKVFYQRVGDTFDHTAGSYVLDASGRARLFLRQTLSPEDIAYDVRQLLRE
jgi:protein SCO1